MIYMYIYIYINCIHQNVSAPKKQPTLCFCCRLLKYSKHISEQPEIGGKAPFAGLEPIWLMGKTVASWNHGRSSFLNTAMWGQHHGCSMKIYETCRCLSNNSTLDWVLNMGKTPLFKTISTNRVSVTNIFKQASTPEHPLFKHTTTSNREYYPLLLDSYLQYVDLYNWFISE